jgi:hypothetical protein
LVLLRRLIPGQRVGGGAPLDVVFLYNRVTKKLKALDSINDDDFSIRPGQVNGSWATWVTDISGDFVSYVHRRNLKTGRDYEIKIDSSLDNSHAVDLHDSAIGSDGTLYYWRYDERSGTDPTPQELVRNPVVGAARVILTVSDTQPSNTFVEDRPDGTKAVYYSLDGDILKIIDNP